jgi:hypothetical protein
LEDIARTGNMTNAIPGNTLAHSPLISAESAINQFQGSGGVLPPSASIIPETGIPKYTNEGGSPIIGDTPAGNGQIVLGNSSWYYGEPHYMPMSNAGLGSSFTGDNATRTGLIAGTGSLGGGRLGQSDLTFETLYNNDQTGKWDDRLNIRYTNSGYRGLEPYIVYHNGGLEINSPEGRFLGTPYDINGIASRSNPDEKTIIDWERTLEFFNSPKGLGFVGNQALMQFLGGTRQTIFLNPLSLFSQPGVYGRPGLNFNRSLSPVGALIGSFFTEEPEIGALLGGMVVPIKYESTLYEKNGLISFFLGEGPPGDTAATLSGVLNAFAPLTGVMLKGNAFQTLGLNKKGQTSFLNVSGHSLLGGFQSSFSFNPRHSVPLGSFPENSNPRALFFDETLQPALSPWQKIVDVATWWKEEEEQPPNTKKEALARKMDWVESSATPAGGNKSIPQDLNDRGEKYYSTKKPLKLGKYEDIPDPASSVHKNGFYEKKISIHAQRTADSVGIFSQYAVYNPPDGTTSTKEAYEKNNEAQGATQEVGRSYVSSDLPTGTGFRFLKGDLHTLLPVNPGSTISDAYPGNQKAAIKETGYPFYFKDMRDNSYVFFRAYITGLSENVNPSWEETNYVGRSEPVYSYQRTTRDISMTLELYAQTRHELDAIYDKLTKLSSMCYPRYKPDNFNFNGKLRALPPMVKMRLGDLYGKEGNETLGHFKTVSYSFPDNNQWETEDGHQVPKHVTVTISYQVQHAKSPNALTEFFGKRVETNISHVPIDEKNTFGVTDDVGTNVPAGSNQV